MLYYCLIQKKKDFLGFYKVIGTCDFTIVWDIFMKRYVSAAVSDSLLATNSGNVNQSLQLATLLIR